MLFNSLSVQQANREKRKDREKDVCTGHHDKTQRYDGIMKSYKKKKRQEEASLLLFEDVNVNLFSAAATPSPSVVLSRK